MNQNIDNIVDLEEIWGKRPKERKNEDDNQGHGDVSRSIPSGDSQGRRGDDRGHRRFRSLATGGVEPRTIRLAQAHMLGFEFFAGDRLPQYAPTDLCDLLARLRDDADPRIQ